MNKIVIFLILLVNITAGTLEEVSPSAQDIGDIDRTQPDRINNSDCETRTAIRINEIYKKP